jgi:hypothetical protein
LHVHGMGGHADLAKRVKPAIDLIDQAAKKAAPPEASAIILDDLRDSHMEASRSSIGHRCRVRA